MPKNSKIRGMTSLEIAIIVAIVLVIAIAVGWYLYVTFASASQQTGLTVMEAAVYVCSSDGGSAVLRLRVVPQGTAQAQISRIELAGRSFVYGDKPEAIVSGPTTITVDVSGLSVAVGQILGGRVVLTNGMVSPFTAPVLAGDACTGTGSDGGDGSGYYPPLM